MRILLAWLSNADLRAAEGDAAGEGPVLSALRERRPSELVLLSAQSPERALGYLRWLRGKHTNAKLVLEAATLRSPTHLGDIHEAAVGAIGKAIDRHPR